MSANPSRRVELELVDPYSPRAQQIWNDLRCHSFFLSWGWIENWLACLPIERAPRLAVFLDDGRPVAAGFLGQRLDLRHRVIASRALHLNTTGVVRFDELWVEYNGLAGDELPIEVVADALPGWWDELVLPGLREHAFGGLRDEDRGRHRVRVIRAVPAYHVDLHGVRADGYLAKLSGQTRSQIRKAQRLAGPISIDVASDEREAIAIYDELCGLHVTQWRAKGQPGAFADPWFDRFHRRLIAKRFASGEIQLLRVRGAAGTLGCLYNFVWGGRVLQYQSGFPMIEDARIKPGFICHTGAIEHCAAANLDLYDFLGGEMRYKKSLSTGAGQLVWAKVQQRRLRFTLEDHLLRIVRERRARARSNVTSPHDSAPAPPDS